jgi:hypothetical protein
MIPRSTDHYDRVVVAGDTVHLSIRLNSHDALGYFDLREDDSKVNSVTIRQSHNGTTTEHDAQVIGAREVRHIFSESEQGEYTIRARVALSDGRQISVPATDPLRVWVAAE